uniref:Fibronectin type-III domain-containing protein n=1 Tax=Meloidogyne hapla TaxID=6305 RepID=A0A1I8AZX2_MELHA
MLININSDGFNVQWEPPLIPNGVVLGYSIYWSSNPDAELSEWSQKNFDSDARGATITDQQEQTPYVIRLQAFGSDGPGLISPSYEVVTGLKHIPLNIPFGNASIGPVHLILEPDPSTVHRFISVPTEARTSTSRTLICEARNDQGQVRDGHVFRVLRPGGPPLEFGSLKLFCITLYYFYVEIDNSVTLDWGPPIHPNVNLTGYIVYISPDPNLPLEQWRIFTIDAKQPELTLPRGELEPQTPYYVRVAAENPYGRGQLSDISRFVTLSGAPIDTPTDLSVQIEPDNTIRASWNPPTQPNGELKHYTVYFISEDKALEMPDADEKYQNWPSVQVPAKEYVIGQVMLDRETYAVLPNTTYRIRVTASNELSEGPATPKAVFRTGSGEVVPTLKLEPPDNPANIKPLEDYSVLCIGTGLPAPDIWWTLGTEVDRQQGGAQLSLGKLSKDIVAVCHAQNNAGVVELTLNVQVAGPGTPPNEIVAIPLASQILSIEWAPPDEPNGKLIGYVLHYAEVPDDKTELAEDDWKKVRVGQDANKHQLEALKPKALLTNLKIFLNFSNCRQTTGLDYRQSQIGERALSPVFPLLLDPVKARTLPLAPKAPDVMPVEVHPNNTGKLHTKLIVQL